ncbi:hypothetical protein Ae505Ps2_2236 [Pseudonocardia sp. Ae505_Ps2]|nr:hypothetical protein Ae505Ps2_2236 [Pseudonocardia sp. Ae505_Ps2]
MGREAVRREVEAAQHAKHHKRGRHTDRPAGTVWCRFCGVKVRSALGDVCSHRRCQQRAAL